MDAPGTTTVGTLGSIESEGVRCVKDYNVVILTGTDAQTVRPYRESFRFVDNGRDVVGGRVRHDGCRLFYRDGAL